MYNIYALSFCSCDALILLTGLYRLKRTAATHVLAVMISPDDCKRKPYALPVQCIPYTSLNEQQIRSIVTGLAKTMKQKRMDVVGRL